MAKGPKQSDIPFEIRLDVQYAQPKPDAFAFAKFDISRTKSAYEPIPGHHSFHRDFLEMSGVLERAAREFGADWSVEKTQKDPEAKWDPKEGTKAYYDGGYADLLYQAAVLTSTAGIALKIVKTIQPTLIQWLKNRSAVFLRVKVGTNEVSVRGQHDIDEILKLLSSVAANQSQKAASGSAKKRAAGSTKKQGASRKQAAATKKTGSSKSTTRKSPKAKARS